jgi:3-phenylpropionate/trans-cinnamate dioxygenase ferredoxin subunit
VTISAQHRIADASELKPGGMLRVEVDGRAYCIARVDSGEVYAVDDLCTHEDESLSEGELWGCHIECPAHGSRFDVTDGEVSGLPAKTPTKTYPCHVVGDDIFIDV